MKYGLNSYRIQQWGEWPTGVKGGSRVWLVGRLKVARGTGYNGEGERRGVVHVMVEKSSEEEGVVKVEGRWGVARLWWDWL
ncbi:hypothetical protein Pmani_025678 [Petrolisthes manimaculis]|uniref:Uncharacterized protein n=1 Tax=Petrolisthes manimaculis TaxID=1843537 RepID=A0AAE1P6A3_9EUCA|nr:hypothetical protein Pmani_025678 [Petrolisthes manimaculis]